MTDYQNDDEVRRFYDEIERPRFGRLQLIVLGLLAIALGIGLSFIIFGDNNSDEGSTEPRATCDYGGETNPCDWTLAEITLPFSVDDCFGDRLAMGAFSQAGVLQVVRETSDAERILVAEEVYQDYFERLEMCDQRELVFNANFSDCSRPEVVAAFMRFQGEDNSPYPDQFWLSKGLDNDQLESINDYERAVMCNQLSMLPS